MKMDKLIIGLSAILVFIGSSRAQLAGDRYHVGHLLEFGQPQSTFCGLFYDKAPNDSITIQNQKFLCKYRNEIDIYRNSDYLPDEFMPGPRFKLVPLDSTFISVYIPNYYDSGHAYFMLNDLKNGGSYFLSNFSLDDYNRLIRLQKITGPIDYILLAQLSLILTNIKSDYYFINSFDDYFFTFKILGEFCLDDKYDELRRLCANKIKNAQIDTLKNCVRVTLYATSWGYGNINKYVVFFHADSISSVEFSNKIDPNKVFDILNDK